MRRRVLVALVAAAASAAALAPNGTAATGGPRLSASASRFPDRVYVLTLPTRKRLSAADVQVTENGQPVHGLSVTPPGAAGLTTIIAIDSSNSMRGKPIEDAVKAARVLVAQRGEHTKVGVVFFNKKATVALAPTRDSAQIQRALSTVPKTAEGTRIYDALQTSANLLASSGSTAGAVILLTDGADVGSSVTQDAAVSALASARSRVFAVGLRSPAYTPDTLQTLAGRTGGSYVEADTSGSLASVFSAIGVRLSNEYLLLYRSLEKPSQKVNVAVHVNGYSRTFRDTYTTPALGLDTRPFERSFWDKLVTSWWLMLLVVVGVVWLFAWGLWTMLDARRRTLRARMSHFVALEPIDEGLSRKRLLERITDFAESFESRGRFFRRFSEQCEIAGIETAPGVLLLASAAVGLVLGVLLAVAWHPVFIVMILVAPFTTVLYVRFRLRRQRRTFADQLPDNLDVLAGALRAGHSLVGGMTVMARDAGQPSKREFERVIADEQLGVPLDESLKRVGARMENPDMTQVALIALLQRETGSSSAEVIDHVANNIRARMEVRRLVRTLTAQGRLARWIVSFMPLALLIAISVIVPGYLDPLFHTALGIVFLVVGTILVMLGSFVIKRIVEIKV